MPLSDASKVIPLRAGCRLTDSRPLRQGLAVEGKGGAKLEEEGAEVAVHKGTSGND